MSLSIFTNPSSMSATNSLNRSNGLLSTAMQRLGTGKRINSAADDAAGLQIATRLESQSRGMNVARRNIADGTALLQTAEGAFDEMGNILHRMKDLATQAANGTNSEKDIAAMDAEYQALYTELDNIMNNTSYGGEKLFTSSSSKSLRDDGGAGATDKKGKFESKITLQIGASSDETMEIDLADTLKALKDNLAQLGQEIKGGEGGGEGGEGGEGGGETRLNAQTSNMRADAKEGLTSENANERISQIAAVIDDVASMRSNLGASINRLGHTEANLANIRDNTELAKGNIMDADFAEEASNMTRNQMLAQTSMTMLKQSNQMAGMVMSLLN